MKKILLLTVCVLMVLVCFSSCGDSKSTSVETTDKETESIVETETDAPTLVIPPYFNPLTGLGSEKDLSLSRPVAIMINNLWGALPQEGISNCDIMYECLVEGGITRLMVLSADYGSLGAIGSVRSSRHYYLDLAQNYDAIYVHAGGSSYAYEEIKSRGINNLDGVNMYVPGMFYRDAKRLETMSYEHTLMTTGEKTVTGISFKKYRTELKDEFKNKSAFNFVDYGTDRAILGDDANCIYLPYSKYQQARFDYNAETNTYFRYQFEDVAHIDGTTGKQIDFTNVMILFCPTKVIAGDSAGRLDITTEGSGTGYYAYGGKYEPITWRKPTEDSPTEYFGVDGAPLVLNRGKTFISIFPVSAKDTVQFNYELPVASENVN